MRDDYLPGMTMNTVQPMVSRSGTRPMEHMSLRGVDAPETAEPVQMAEGLSESYLLRERDNLLVKLMSAPTGSPDQMRILKKLTENQRRYEEMYRSNREDF